MKKTINFCDSCEIGSNEGAILYECTKCKMCFCEDCIIEHMIDEKIIIEVEEE